MIRVCITISADEVVQWDLHMRSQEVMTSATKEGSLWRRDPVHILTSASSQVVMTAQETHAGALGAGSTERERATEKGWEDQGRRATEKAREDQGRRATEKGWERQGRRDTEKGWEHQGRRDTEKGHASQNYEGVEGCGSSREQGAQGRILLCAWVPVHMAFSSTLWFREQSTF